MSDVRAKAGIPVLSDFSGTITPAACAPLVVDSTTGFIYSWKSGDVIVLAGGGGGTVTHSAGNLTANALALGNGNADLTVMGSLGTSTTVLHGNAAGTPTFGSVVLTSDVSGILPAANGGTASAFFAVAGPSIARTYTFPDASTTILTTNASVTVSQGGTGQATLTNHGVLIGAGTGAITQSAVGASNTLLHGNTGADPTFSAVVEADVSLSDVTTNNVSSSKHGFAPKNPNDATKYLDGTGAYSVPVGSNAFKELGSGTATSNQNITSTASPGTDVTGLTVTCTPDGTHPVYVDVYLPQVFGSSAVLVQETIAIQKDGVVVQTCLPSTLVADGNPVFMRFRDAAPSNASHVYKVSAWSGATNTITLVGSSTAVMTITVTQIQT